MKITIIDYGLGNLASVANALKGLGIPYLITDSVSEVKASEALILPGVGSAGAGMRNLKSTGMDRVIIDKVHSGIPILGICLGMQIMMSFSDEGETDCMDLIKGNVRKFRTKFKVPQIGWNGVRIKKQVSSIKGIKIKIDIFQNITDESYFYFVNSYYCAPADESVIAGTTIYGRRFCSAFEYKNIFGVQFHPEKSGETGLKLLKNFYNIAEQRKEILL